MNSSSSRTEQTLQLLTALADGPLHGYGIIREGDRLSGGRMRRKVGTICGALDRLTVEGLLAPDREETVDGRLRRYFRLTDNGGVVLAEEAERMAAQAAAVAVVLGRLRERGVGRGAVAGGAA